MLLDTHAAVWFARGVELSDTIRSRITEARQETGVFLSAATVWEVGNLLRKRKLQFAITLGDWVRGFDDIGGFRHIAVTAEVVVEADALPGDFHDDPADRFLVATARLLDVPFVTRDKRILDYAKAGHVQAVMC